MVVNKSVKRVSLRMEWWGRKSSALEHLKLVDVQGMDVKNMESFTALLESERPEEELFGTPQGVVDARDAVINANAYLRWAFDDKKDLAAWSSHLTFDHPVGNARTFSDDGKSEWVDVLVPGYGRCQVQRDNLTFVEEITRKTTATRLTSLRIGIDGFNGKLDGLLQFLTTTGSHLESLRIQAWQPLADANGILERCPRLQELVLCSKLADIRLDFRTYLSQHEELPAFGVDWSDTVALTEALSDTSRPLSQCVRKLRVRLNKTADSAVVVRCLQNLLKMLLVNSTLEYLDVAVLPGHNGYEKDFVQFNLKPIRRAMALPMDMKLAFLSVMCCGSFSENSQKRQRLKSRFPSSHLNQDLLTNILAYAAPLMRRQVTFRYEDGKWREYRHHEIPI